LLLFAKDCGLKWKTLMRLLANFSLLFVLPMVEGKQYTHAGSFEIDLSLFLLPTQARDTRPPTLQIGEYVKEQKPKTQHPGPTNKRIRTRVSCACGCLLGAKSRALGEWRCSDGGFCCLEWIFGLARMMGRMPAMSTYGARRNTERYRTCAFENFGHGPFSPGRHPLECTRSHTAERVVDATRRRQTVYICLAKAIGQALGNRAIHLLDEFVADCNKALAACKVMRRCQRDKRRRRQRQAKFFAAIGIVHSLDEVIHLPIHLVGLIARPQFVFAPGATLGREEDRQRQI
jgi:hypothetical protein